MEIINIWNIDSDIRKRLNDINWYIRIIWIIYKNSIFIITHRMLQLSQQIINRPNYQNNTTYSDRGRDENVQLCILWEERL